MNTGQGNTAHGAGCNQPPTTTSSSTPQQCQRGQQQQKGTQQCNQRTHFEGAINELKGHIYDLVGSHSADLFTTAT